ncbi:PREDICTED: methionine--tRNA ligase, mitochondrial [Nicrophorus vespilloides]|uniref:Methionine--tRNA ligase, mitochondrial n=1 Tax=Nicrophorus vespilloides TaxID=110193 RepID=A0ABM1MMK9_NICVS|nr:PREDICTED: methionine--tRNA ligase, mitochondrial [Nicrophorus vespilloides]
MRLPGSLLNKCSARNSFYVTTPIYYVNATPHIGHLYSSVIADCVGRWHQLIHSNGKYKFATGTDEHGTKIQQAAVNNKTSVDQYCNSISQKYRNLSDQFSVGYTDFIRTTDEKHQQAVKHFWKKLSENGHIYSAKYSGWYCVSDETFLVETQLNEVVSKDGRKVRVSAESGHPVEWTEEENYMFRLSGMHGDLLHWLKDESVVKPKKFHKILMDMLEEGLPDVSVSRPSSRVHWGIRVPGDDAQSIYVWLDALVNYLTASGYPDKRYKDFWPADLHVIGKDILKFHGIYWPAFLMAANMDPPRSILCHSHWTVEGEKMSKSKHNVVCPFERSELYTTDGLRYFLLREGVAHSDGNYSDTKVLRILNSELADTLGNLLSRCTGGSLNPQQTFPAIETAAFDTIASLDVTKNLLHAIETLPEICYENYSSYAFHKVADATIKTLHTANLFFETLKPWELKRDASTLPQLDVVLHLVMECLRVSGIVLSPMVPNISETLLNKMNVPEVKRTWASTTQLSWKDEAFQSNPLALDKTILFRRILLEKSEDKKVRAKK